MNTLIIYATKYGCTEKCAKILSEKLEEKADLCNLKTVNDIDLAQYQKVIIGGSIYMGRIQKEVKGFCSKNLNILQEKKLGLFICCMGDEESSETQLKDSFPEELMNKAVAKDFFGGEFVFGKMNFIEKFIVKKVSKIEKDTSKILEGNINSFAQAMNNF